MTDESAPGFVAAAERVAVFDNDGTLWCEKPMPVELGFILERLAAMAADDASLRERQPWKAAHERDYGWLGGAMTKHYAGDDSDAKLLIGGSVAAFADWTVEAYEAEADAFLREARHPSLGRLLRDCTYVPMVELLRYLEANGFTAYIASGGSRDFMRSVADAIYGIPPERVIGSSNALELPRGRARRLGRLPRRSPTCSTTARPSPSASGAASAGGRSSPSATRTATSRCCASRRIRRGRRSRCSCSTTTPSASSSTSEGADVALKQAGELGWGVVSMRDDWSTVFDAV